MGEQVSERESLARALYQDDLAHGRVGLSFDDIDPGVRDWYRDNADAALAWFTERVEALIDRYDDPGYGMQEDEWRFVRDLRALYTAPTTESEGR